MSKLLEKLKAELEATKESARRREERINNCEVEWTDCSLSIWANNLHQEELETKIQILENGGVWSFNELCYLDGTPTNAKIYHNKWGSSWLVIKPDRSQEWVNTSNKEKTLLKKGYMMGEVTRPAWAKVSGSGRGLAGAMSCYVEIFPSKVNYALDEKAAVEA